MSELFILQNQHKLFLGKQNAWVDGQDPAALYKTPFKDEAINQMVEVGAKDYTQRIKVVRCDVSDKGLPVIDPTILPEPLPGAQDMFADHEQANPEARENAETMETLAAESPQE